MFFRHNICSLLWALLIVALCGLPSRQFPNPHIFGFDKVVHVFIYAVFSHLLIVGFSKQHQFRKFTIHAKAYGLGTSISYGLIIELLQGTMFVSRSLELADIGANIIGSFIGVFSFYLIYKNIKT